jgi:hypothetical protein
MDGLFALFGTSVVSILIFGIFFPQIITTLVMSYKGYSGCLWLFFSLFLSWIGVIIAICMPNVRRREERHIETIAAMTSQNRSQTVIVNNQENEQTQHLPPRPAPNFRLQAIQNLKAIGTPFDEYDLELEIEEVKKEQEEFRLREASEQERQRQEEQALAEEEKRNRKRIKDQKNAKLFTRLAIVIGALLLHTALFFSVVYFLQNSSVWRSVLRGGGLKASPPVEVTYNKEQSIADTNDEVVFEHSNISKSNYDFIVIRKTFFHSKPLETTTRKAYFVKGDSIKALKEENGYVYVEFTHPTTRFTSKGWINKNDLLPILSDIQR